MGKNQPDLEPSKVLERFRQSTLKYRVKRMIPFGSQITGEAEECSHVDILVVSSNKNKLGLLPKLYHEWHMVQEIMYPVDCICYTPDEFAKMKNMITLVKEVRENGLAIET